MQDSRNCAHCCAPLGSMRLQLEHVLQRHVDALPESFNTPISDMFACPQNCGEFFCEQSCFQRCFDQYHRLTCVGPIDSEEHPLYLYKQLSVDAGEVFLLALKVYASILSSSSREQQNAFLELFSVTHGADWMDVLQCPPDEDPVTFKEQKRQLLCVMYGYLEAALCSNQQQKPSPELFNLDAFSRVLATLERNLVTVEIESPVQQFLDSLPSLTPDVRVALEQTLEPTLELVRAQKEEDWEDISEEEEMEEEAEDVTSSEPVDNGVERLFEGFDGSGLYPFVSMLNHSCEPNATFTHHRNFVITVTAHRSINVGEEICISYLGKNSKLSVADRQEALREYGFVCSCSRCQAEQ
eukprot:GILK01009448.1.p1 GENE.GILK01009448.1~~GILK01009448.1.p1  ORF type:complete len:410 (+),score=62.49 GILK01009448.1:170-1231(+)